MPDRLSGKPEQESQGPYYRDGILNSEIPNSRQVTAAPHPHRTEVITTCRPYRLDAHCKIFITKIPLSRTHQFRRG